MSVSAAEGVQKSREQREAEEYLSRIKLKEIFQGLLGHVIVHQPEDPIGYFQEEITRIKKEMEESNVDIGSTTFLTSARAPPPRTDQKKIE